MKTRMFSFNSTDQKLDSFKYNTGKYLIGIVFTCIKPNLTDKLSTVFRKDDHEYMTDVLVKVITTTDEGLNDLTNYISNRLFSEYTKLYFPVKRYFEDRVKWLKDISETVIINSGNRDKHEKISNKINDFLNGINHIYTLLISNVYETKELYKIVNKEYYKFYNFMGEHYNDMLLYSPHLDPVVLKTIDKLEIDSANSIQLLNKEPLYIFSEIYSETPEHLIQLTTEIDFIKIGKSTYFKTKNILTIDESDNIKKYYQKHQS